MKNPYKDENIVEKKNWEEVLEDPDADLPELEDGWYEEIEVNYDIDDMKELISYNWTKVFLEMYDGDEEKTVKGFYGLEHESLDNRTPYEAWMTDQRIVRKWLSELMSDIYF